MRAEAATRNNGVARGIVGTGSKAKSKGYMGGASATAANTTIQQCSLQWTTSDTVLDFAALHPQQVVNHFERNNLLTSKGSLPRVLRRLPWLCSCDSSEWFPRSYLLSDPSELEIFRTDFRRCAARNILRWHTRAVDDHQGNINVISGPLGVLQLALRICMDWVDEWGDAGAAIDVSADSKRCKIPSDVQWELLLRVSYWCTLVRDGNAAARADAGLRSALNTSRYTADAAAAIVAACTSTTGELDTHRKQLCALAKPRQVPAYLTSAAQAAVRKLSLRAPQHRPWLCPHGTSHSARASSGTQLPYDALDDDHNLWIVKPADSSRGVGLALHGELAAIEACAGGVGARVVQKYIERPMLLPSTKESCGGSPHGVKFDVRIWVLVTSWEPLSAAIFEPCYARLCTKEYSCDVHKWEDRERHFTNYSVQQNNGDGDKITWSQSRLEALLCEREGHERGRAIWNHDL